MRQYRKVLVAMGYVAMLVGMVARVSSSYGATITAASCSTAHTQTAVNAATDGDIVLIPNGACAWASGISTTKQIWIRAENYTEISGGSDTRNVNITHNAADNDLFDMTTGNSFSARVSGIKFLRGSGTGPYITVSGIGSKIGIVDNVYFEQTHDFGILRGVHWVAMGGLFYDTMWESLEPGGGGGPGSGSGCFYVEPPAASLPWASASTMGMLDTNGDKNLYIEDSSFHHIYNQALDGADHARVVVRYSTVLNSQFLTHGSTGLAGGRHFEMYNNAFRFDPATFGDTYEDVALTRYMWFRAGTGLFTDNSFENITSQTWSNGDEIMFTVENLHRGDFGGNGEECCDVYPCFHQVGFGHNGTSQVSDPVYIWNNTGFTPVVGFNEGQPDGCPGGPASETFIQLNRDYFVGTAKPGYVKYTYPHPARDAWNGSVFIGSPTNLTITASTTITFLSAPTGTSVTANTVVPLGNPSGVAIGAADTPAFPTSPTGAGLTAAGTPVFPGTPSSVAITIP